MGGCVEEGRGPGEALPRDKIRRFGEVAPSQWLEQSTLQQHTKRDQRKERVERKGWLRSV